MKHERNLCISFERAAAFCVQTCWNLLGLALADLHILHYRLPHPTKHIAAVFRCISHGTSAGIFVCIRNEFAHYLLTIPGTNVEHNFPSLGT